MWVFSWLFLCSFVVLVFSIDPFSSVMDGRLTYLVTIPNMSHSLLLYRNNLFLCLFGITFVLEGDFGGKGVPRGFNPIHSTNNRMNDYENAIQVSRRDSAKRFLFSLGFMIRHIVPFSDTQSNGLSPVCALVICVTVDRRYEKAEG